ncbi:TniQ family protein [Psychromonas sp. L1A2]|uniref:TniQ family protein n=1 Tax=Psychromonas sp. L1A2 TaxID=2686356 RepID=UPI0013578EAD|nr:TniQ family protein [Psychromonas sp. L1A2]
MSKFLIRSKPYKEESLQQYLLRIAKVNGYTIKALNSFIIKKTGFSYRQINAKGRESLKQQLFTMTGHIEVMELFDHRQWSKEFKLIFDSVRLKICPQCLGEYRHCFSEWHYLHNLVCMQHKVFLVEQCNKCQRVLTDDSLLLDACLGCGFKLHEMSNGDCALPYFYGNISLISAKELHQKKLAEILKFTSNLIPYYKMLLVNSAFLWRREGRGNIHNHVKLLAQVILFHFNPKQVEYAFVEIIDDSQEQYSLSKSLGSIYWDIIQPKYSHIRNAFRQVFTLICKEFPDMYITLEFLDKLFYFNLLNIKEHKREELVFFLHQRPVLYLRDVEYFLGRVNSKAFY